MLNKLILLIKQLLPSSQPTPTPASPKLQSPEPHCINQAGISLIKEFEGCKLTAYQDIVGIWTIGYGHTGPPVHPGLVLTQQEVDDLLRNDLYKFGIGVNKLVQAEVTENQFAALVCFSYNVGLGALEKSTLLRKLNLNLYTEAADEFLRWDKAGGVAVLGLARRRRAERELFMRS